MMCEVSKLKFSIVRCLGLEAQLLVPGLCRNHYTISNWASSEHHVKKSGPVHYTIWDGFVPSQMYVYRALHRDRMRCRT